MKQLLIATLTLFSLFARAQNANERTILNNTILLPGYLQSAAPIRKYFSFDNNDVIKFDFKLNGKAGTNKIEVYSYPDNEIVYSKDDIKSLVDSFMISKKGVYYFSMMTNHITEKNVSLKVIRAASASSKKDFSTNVVTKSDTTFRQIASDNYNLSSSRYSIPVNIPANCSYWVYWVGVGDEPIIKYETYTEFFRAGKSGNNGNPLYCYGSGKLSDLPAQNSKHVIDYGFADNINATSFLAGKPYKVYTFKSGNGVSADYGKVESRGNMRMLVNVPAQSVGSKLKLIIGGFTINETYLMETP